MRRAGEQFCSADRSLHPQVLQVRAVGGAIRDGHTDAEHAG